MSELKIFTDGGARGNPGPAGIGIFVQNEVGQEIYAIGRYIGEQTNNVAEYTALITALEWLQGCLSATSIERVTCHLDSKLVVEQVNGNWKVKQPHIQPLVLQVRQLAAALPCPITFTYVPREQNKDADLLVNQALDAALA